MKINKFIGLLACTMAFTACQNDMLEAEMQQDDIYTLSGKMSAGRVMSRAQIELGSSNSAEEIAFWNEGDQFYLFQNINKNLNQSIFTISSDYSESGSERQSATFVTETPAKGGVNYTAVYPASVMIENGSAKFSPQHSLEFAGATTPEQQAEVWKDYMKNNMFMMAKGTLSQDGVNVVKFEHLCALARISYTNATGEDQNIYAVNMGGDQSFTTSMSYYIPGEYQNGSGSTNGYEIKTNGLVVEAGATTDLYFFFFPHEFSQEGNLHINLLTNAGYYKGIQLEIAKIREANAGATGFEAGKRYWFKLTETAEGLVWSKDFSMEDVTFTNKELSAALLKNLDEDIVTLTEEGYAVMSGIDVISVEELSLNGEITSVEGIENFVNLKQVYINSTNVTTLDLSQNTKLELVNVQFNSQLTSVNLSNNPLLRHVCCSFNDKLTGFDISNSKELMVLDVENTPLESLVVPNPSLIETLFYGNTKIAPFALTDYKSLHRLDMDNMGLDNLDLIPSYVKAQLETLFVDDNNLTELDLTQFPMLGDLHCNRNNISELNLQATPELVSLSCTENLIETLDVSHLVGMYTLNCGKQQNDIVLNLTLNSDQQTEWTNNWGKSSENANVSVTESATITIENAELAKALYSVLGAGKVAINDNGYAVMKEEDVLATEVLDFDWGQYTITSLSGIEHFVNLTTIIVADTGLETCDFSQNTKLTHVNVQSNNLTSLDLSHCPELNQLYCQYMPNLTKIDLTGCTKLWNFQAQGTGITELTIPNPAAMDNFLIPSGLTVDLNLYTNLTGLGVMNSNLDNLDFIPEDMRSRLDNLFCEGNNLTELDLSQYPNLRYLSCDDNNLTTLDVSVLPGIINFSCTGNRIEELDITSLTKVERVICGNQTINGGDINLKLTLTEAQKTLWDNDWSVNYSWGNANVTLNVVGSGSTTEGGSNTTSGNDFNIEGIY